MENTIQKKFEEFRVWVFERYLSDYKKVDCVLYLNESVNLTIYAYGEPFQMIVTKEDFLKEGFDFLAYLPKYEKSFVWYHPFIIFRDTVLCVRKAHIDGFDERTKILKEFISTIGGLPEYEDTENWNVFMKEHDRVTAMFPMLDISKYHNAIRCGYSEAKHRI